MNKSLENNLKVISLPLLMFFGSIVLFALVANFVGGKITSILSEYERLRRPTVTLTAKLNSLSVNETRVSDFIQNLTAALPPSNSSLLLVSQIRGLVSANLLYIENLKVTNLILDQELNHADVGFDVEGSAASVFSFVAQTSSLAPLNKVARLKLTTSASGLRASITLTTFWAAFPVKVPAVSDPLAEVTPDERRLLDKINGLSRPQFLELVPTAESGRENPFGQ